MTAVPDDPGDADWTLARRLRDTAHLANRLAALHDTGKVAEDPSVEEPASNVRAFGRARKISVSMPEDLATAIQRRVGRGEFSQYVTDAVTRQLELDLLAELSEMLEAEHGPIPDQLVAEAEAEWPDVE